MPVPTPRQYTNEHEHEHHHGSQHAHSHTIAYNQTSSTTVPLAPAHPNVPHAPRRAAAFAPVTPPKAHAHGGEMSDSTSSPSPPRGRCFCGRDLLAANTSIYCSVDCARSDAFSSLCFKPAPTSPPTYAPLSRNPSVSSIFSTMSTSSTDSDWQASHYRRLARADERKEERERRRRRRAAGSTASSNVPDLVHSHSHQSQSHYAGGSHSRNPSTASSASSTGWSAGGLSRNPSSASTASSASRRVRVDAVIMEDVDEGDDDEEMLDDTALPIAPVQRYHHMQPQPQPHQPRRRGGATGPSSKVSSSKVFDGIGMGKDMRDVLEEIIQMEQGFQVDDEDAAATPSTSALAGVAPAAGAGLLSAQLPLRAQAPRTPPIGADSRRRSSVGVPNAPGRAQPYPRRARPPSLMGLHQSSLSESHTALYLATASPSTSASNSRRSASPKLQTRRSITFDPAAVEALVPPGLGRYDSPNVTPSRRRFANPAVTPLHPAITGWRFPSTPSRPAQSQPAHPETISSIAASSSSLSENYDMAASAAAAMTTPVQASDAAMDAGGLPGPHLLWPDIRPPPLAPALFPSSPGTATPISMGLRLGSMLGLSSGSDEAMDLDDVDVDGDVDVDVDVDADVDVDVDVDEGDGEREGAGSRNGRSRTGYLPVFLEAEGFRDRWAI